MLNQLLLTTLCTFSALKNGTAIIALIGGLLLLLMGPRLVYHTGHNEKSSCLTHSLLTRWAHLFVLEVLAGIFICCGLYIIGFVTNLSLLPTTATILGLALIISCLLGKYI
jgi:hypothetical protein